MSSPAYRPYVYLKTYLTSLDFPGQGLAVAGVTDFHPAAARPSGGDGPADKARAELLESEIRADAVQYQGVYVAAASYEESLFWEALGWRTLVKEENQGGRDCWNMLKRL